MAHATQNQAMNHEHTIALSVAKLALASFVVFGILSVFAASAYFQGTRPPQTPIRSMPR